MATATQNGFSRTQGFVEQVKRGDNRVAIKLGEHWFSKFGSLEVDEGDEVAIKYRVVEKGDRTYRNIQHVEPVNPTPTSTTAGNVATSKDDAIARAVALKSAVAWAKGVETVPQVLTAADAFLNWLQGAPVTVPEQDEQDVPF